MTWELHGANTDQGLRRLTEVRDPTNRWIKISYLNSNQTLPTLVYGSDGQWVKYTWSTRTYREGVIVWVLIVPITVMERPQFTPMRW